jgi:hypothetical protein
MKNKYKLDGQIDIFGNIRQKYRYSIYAVPRYHDEGQRRCCNLSIQ